MNRIQYYIFRQLLWTMLFVTATLTCVVWLTQSLRFVEMIINRGLSVSIFIYFTLLMLPTFLSVILPIALFAATLFTYNKLLMDGELVVLRAAGLSEYDLSRPAIVLAILVTLAGYALTIQFIPSSFREFKDLQFTLRNSFSAVMLQEGVFNTIMKGVTVYVRKRNADGELLGILVHDRRSPKEPVTMMAERGALVDGEKGPRVVMITGNRQVVSADDGKLSLLYFDRYNFDIGGDGSTKEGSRWREPRERFLDELFYPMAQEKKLWNFYKLRMEGHHRLALPLMTLAFVLVGLACLLRSEFNRRGQFWRILIAVAIIIAMEVLFLGFKNMGEKAPWLTPLLYATPVLPGLAGAYLLSPLFRIRRRRFPATAAGPLKP